MFRLIQLHAQQGVPRIGIDPDGYGSEHAALARYRESPASYFGIGRFDDMMKIRGNNVWPSAVDAAVFAHREIAEYVGKKLQVTERLVRT